MRRRLLVLLLLACSVFGLLAPPSHAAPTTPAPQAAPDLGPRSDADDGRGILRSESVGMLGWVRYWLARDPRISINEAPNGLAPLVHYYAVYSGPDGTRSLGMRTSPRFLDSAEIIGLLEEYGAQVTQGVQSRKRMVGWAPRGMEWIWEPFPEGEMQELAVDVGGLAALGAVCLASGGTACFVAGIAVGPVTGYLKAGLRGTFYSPHEAVVAAAIGAVPFGRAAKGLIPARSLQILGQGFSESEMWVAHHLAAQGRVVVLRQADSAAGRTSDLLLNDIPYDVYTPVTGNLSRIVSSIAAKGSQVRGGGVVLDLSRSPLTPEGAADLLPRVRGITDQISDIIVVQRRP